MGVCCCARSSPLRAQKRQVLACPVLYRTGAPRSMKMGTVLSPYRYDAGARHALQSSRNAAVPRGFEWHMLAGGDGTAWLAFLNTVRTERFDQVLALRPLLLAHREGRVGQGPRKRKAGTSGLAKPSEPAPHERAALDAIWPRRSRFAPDAHAEVAEVLRINPKYTIGGTQTRVFILKRADDIEHTVIGLRKAGLPE